MSETRVCRIDYNNSQQNTAGKRNADRWTSYKSYPEGVCENPQKAAA